MALTQAQIVEALTVGASSAFVEGLSVTTPHLEQDRNQGRQHRRRRELRLVERPARDKGWVGARMLVELGSHGYQIQQDL